MDSRLAQLQFDRSWTLFLDRDGVINKKRDNDYVKAVTEFEWIPGALDALALMAPLFQTVVIVTNQQGVGKGVMSEADLNAIHQHMIHKVRLHGGRVDAVYFAPWLKEQNHPERKPGIGMAQNAKRDFPAIDFTHSLMVGDSVSDVAFGKQAGMYTVLIGKPLDPVSTHRPDFVFDTLLELANALRAEVGRGK